MQQEPTVIRLDGVSIFHNGNPYKPLTEKNYRTCGELVLHDVSLSVHTGEFVYFIGKVGTGKSSLLKTLYAEVPLLEGSGRIAGFNLRTIRNSEIPQLRRRIGIVFQDVKLLFDMTVQENLEFVMKATGWKSKTEIEQRIEECLKMVGMQQKASKMPFELSGGERQRIAIARALLNSPRIILADEPTANLDPVTADAIMKLFESIAASGTAVVMSTHNTQLVENHPARVVLFSQGTAREVEIAAPEEPKSTI